MAKTNSIAFPNMFSVSRNRVNTYEDDKSVVNRTRLLILTDPTELYHNPQFGVGLKKHLWTYNNENRKSIIQDEIKAQLRLHEPYAIADDTQFSDGLLFTGSSNDNDVEEIREINHLKMTCAIKTVYQTTAEVNIDGDNIGRNI